MAMMLAKIGYGFEVVTTYSADDGRLQLPNGNYIGIDTEEDLRRFGLDLRALLANADITAEEAETVRLERELEQARVDDLIFWYRIDSPSTWSRRREWNAIICWKPDGVTTNAYGPNRFSAVTNATDMLRARRSELEAAKAAEAEAQAVAAQEARIMEAFHAAKIGLPESPKKPRADGYWVYTLAPAEEYRPASMVIAGHSTRSFPYTVRLAAATAAADWAEALTAKPALPEPVTMTPHAKACELKARGYDRMDQDLPCWQREGHYIPMHPMCEIYDGYLSRAVVEARRRDGAA